MNIEADSSSKFYPNWVQWSQDLNAFEVCSGDDKLIITFPAEQEAVEYCLTLNKNYGDAK